MTDRKGLKQSLLQGAIAELRSAAARSADPLLFRGVQVPELDVSVSCCDEVAAVLGEGDGEDGAGHLVGGDDGAFLLRQEQRSKT